jgi:hypothetical protein
MKLIREEVLDVHTLTEESNGKKNMFLEGIFMQAIPNRNGRLYPMETLQKETQRYIEEKVNTGRAWGELGHPDGPSINADRISHRITSLRFEGKNVIGKARLIDENPSGKIARGLIESGGTIGMSSRGLGSLKQLDNGLLEVQEDFKLVTAADIVMDPSAPDAFVQGIMENVEWVYKNGEWIAEKADYIKQSIHKMSKKQLEESKVRIFEHFLNEISKET